MSTILPIVIFIIIFYLWSIAPRLFARPDMTFFKRYHYAHRGLHNDRAPENSLSAFANAIERGYGIELDVRLTKDNIPVVFHDESLERMCNINGRINDFTFNELKAFTLLNTQETIPSLKDVLALVNGSVPLIIELKAAKNTTALCMAVNHCIADYSGKYCIQSFYPSVLRWYRANRPDIARGQLSGNFLREKKVNLPFAALSALLTNFYTRPDFIAYNCKHPHTISRIICRKIFRAPSIAWTVRSVREFINIKNYFDSYIFEDFELSNKIL